MTEMMAALLVWGGVFFLVWAAAGYVGGFYDEGPQHQGPPVP